MDRHVKVQLIKNWFDLIWSN